jgi:hypothetical protein
VNPETGAELVEFSLVMMPLFGILFLPSISPGCYSVEQYAVQRGLRSDCIADPGLSK